MNNIKYEIKKQLGIISTSPKGWTKEINLVSWNGAEPKYDIRDWSPEHDKMGKGITLTKDEIGNVYRILGEILSNGEL
ncbi:MAG: hypothetical protein LUC97_02280 [Clostridiales bacterium]|nr:hypothetical protein [Clostridiales bacterium]